MQKHVFFWFRNSKMFFLHICFLRGLAGKHLSPQQSFLGVKAIVHLKARILTDRLSRPSTIHTRFNPLTPVPPVTVRDEPWPFFHFWRHHFWPKLASSILNFCRSRRSFQWCPDQSDRPNGALDMHKNAQKVEWKTQTKISCHYTWLLHAKNCPKRWRFSF